MIFLYNKHTLKEKINIFLCRSQPKSSLQSDGKHNGPEQFRYFLTNRSTFFSSSTRFLRFVFTTITRMSQWVIILEILAVDGY